MEQAGFTGSIDTRQEDSLEDEGTVASVSPAPGASVSPDGTVTLNLSTGTIDLPDVTGRPEAEAVSILTGAGFSEGQIVVEEVDSAEAPGTVVSTTPGPAGAASTGTRIVLQVSRGVAEVAQIAVPDVRGQSAAAAEANLRAAGFSSIQFVSVDEADPGVGTDAVIGTEPPAGTPQPPDTQITALLNPPSD